MKKKYLIIILFVIIAPPLIYFALDYLALLPYEQEVKFKKPLTQSSETAQPSSRQNSQENTDPATNRPLTEQPEVPYQIEVFAENLYVPWNLTFTDENRLIVTERNGQVREIVDGVMNPDPIYIFAEATVVGEAGLMGAALDPDYTQNKFIYFCLAYNGKNKITRLTDSGSELLDEQIIIDNIPSAQFHAGCRIKFGPDNKLYITTGDAVEKDLAQNKSSLAGKILRINADGSFPEDNPFPKSPVYSTGHRNPQGIDWHPVTGELYSTEHGPSVFDGPAGGDEVNLIIAGANYGWPLVSHENNQEGLEAPLLLYTPAVAPASGMFYTGNALPQFTNNYFFGLLKGEGIMRVVFSEEDPEQVILHERLQDIDVGRVRDITTGPDEYIYFTTSNRDGRGELRENDDKIYIIKPQQ